MKRYFLYFIILLSIFFTSCSNKNKSNKKEQLKFSSDIFNIKTGQNLSEIFYLKNKKIVLYTNADCGKCLNELEQWEDFISKFLNDEIDFITIITSSSKEMALYNIMDKIKYNYPVYYDLDSSFF